MSCTRVEGLLQRAAAFGGWHAAPLRWVGGRVMENVFIPKFLAVLERGEEKCALGWLATTAFPPSPNYGQMEMWRNREINEE